MITPPTAGDGALNLIFQRQNLALKSTIERLGAELTTGTSRDTGTRLAGNFTPLAGLAQDLAQLDAYAQTSGLARQYARVSQIALSEIRSGAQHLGTSLAVVEGAGHASAGDTIADDARARLHGALSTLNARVGNRSLFAGAAIDRPALIEADAITAALDSRLAGLNDADAIADAIEVWFDDPAGFSASAYLGAAASASPIAIAEGESAAFTVTALDPAIRETLKGLALAAAIAHPSLTDDSVARSLLTQRAHERLIGADSRMVALQGRLGATEARIAEAEAENNSRRAAFERLRSEMTAVDPYRTATALEQTQQQLDRLFALTARISNLSLGNYLK